VIRLIYKDIEKLYNHESGRRPLFHLHHRERHSVNVRLYSLQAKLVEDEANVGTKGE
jgi:hypothetical protein